MNKNLFLISGVCAILLFACNEKPAMPAISYPPTAKVDQTDLYFGTSVADPYRWLENDTAPDVEAWVKSQNKVTFAYLDKIPF
ncbi:MAG: S9 family peptidase, partial [Bacteroidetes bacterium]